MISKLINRAWFFRRIGFRYFFKRTTFKGEKGAKINIARNVKIRNSTIYIGKNSVLTIEENSDIKDVNFIINGHVHIGKGNIINKGGSPSTLSIIINGTFIIGDFNRIQCRILLRYKGVLKIKDYNNINYHSELRVDEKLEIGSFNQVSYEVNIWDTNTHSIYKADYRRELAIKHYPVFGYEFEKPKTKPVFIGDDCWIGRNVSILKGSYISNRCIIGYQTTISNEKINPNTTVVPKIQNEYIKNDI
ncbi:acyltransferase [Saccharicrinis sp. FJH62]|uniref:acyltransferase n=1 Tax=Saccharicrinis sp. FJH62 TaxID=3344657 RepID=UPI0035D52941